MSSEERVATISMVDDATATPELKEIFKHVEAAMGRVPNLARVIAHSPTILGAFMQLDVGDGLQAPEGALAVILPPEIRRGGQQNFHGVLKQSFVWSMIFSENRRTLFRIML